MTPGTYALAAVSLTTAISAGQTPITYLEGMSAVTLEALFSYGSGGTTCIATVQTSFDEGVTWLDVARFDFATATARKICNLNGHLSKAVTAYVALAAEGVADGVLGDRLRAVIVSAGTYANSSIAVRASVR